MSWNQSSIANADVRDERVSGFLSKVYGWMFLGLLITAGTAFFISSSPAIINAIFANRIVFWILLFGQLGLVFYLSARIESWLGTAAALFLLYSALVGVTSSVILLMYGRLGASNLYHAAGMFGATAVFGTVTKKFGGFGQFMFIGLIGLILAASSASLAKRHAAICDRRSWSNRFYGTHRVGRAEVEAFGCVVAGWTDCFVRGGGCAVSLSRLHQSVFLPASVHRKSPQLGESGGRSSWQEQEEIIFHRHLRLSICHLQARDRIEQVGKGGKRRIGRLS